MASATAPPNGAHQRGVRYPARLGERNSRAVPAAPRGRMRVREAQFVRASRTAGHAGGALLLPHGAHDLQLAARLRGQPAVVDVGRGRAGRGRRRTSADAGAGCHRAAAGHPDARRGAMGVSTVASGAGRAARNRDAAAARALGLGRAVAIGDPIDARATRARAASRSSRSAAPIVAAAARSRPPHRAASLAPRPVPTRSGAQTHQGAVGSGRVCPPARRASPKETP